MLTNVVELDARFVRRGGAASYRQLRTGNMGCRYKTAAIQVPRTYSEYCLLCVLQIAIAASIASLDTHQAHIHHSNPN